MLTSSSILRFDAAASGSTPILIRCANERAAHTRSVARPPPSPVAAARLLRPAPSAGTRHDDLRTRKYHSHNRRTCFGV